MLNLLWEYGSICWIAPLKLRLSSEWIHYPYEISHQPALVTDYFIIVNQGLKLVLDPGFEAIFTTLTMLVLVMIHPFTQMEKKTRDTITYCQKFNYDEGQLPFATAN